MTEKVGFDLTGFRPDYSKSAEDNLKAMREAYRKAYGRYPEEEPSQKQPPPATAIPIATGSSRAPAQAATPNP